MWKHKGNGGWHFVTLPKALSKTIRKVHGQSEEGWGRLKAVARIDKSEWRTAIWYDSKYESYLLPVKADIRKQENLQSGNKLHVKLSLEEEDKRFPGYATACK